MGRGRPTIADTALEHIKSRGPQKLEQLVAAVVAAGRTAARDPVNAVVAAIEHDLRFLESDSCWFSLVDLLDGAIFTHRATHVERLHQVAILRDEDDLIERVVRCGRSGARGSPMGMSSVWAIFDLPWDDESDEANDVSWFDGDQLQDPDTAWDFLMANRSRSALVIPDGRMESLQPDDLFGLVVSEGALAYLAVTPAEIEPDHVAHAIELLSGLVERSLEEADDSVGERAISVRALLESIVVTAPGVLRKPLPPIRELLAAAGFQLRDGQVVKRGAMSSHDAPLDRVELWRRNASSADDESAADDHYNDHMTMRMTATDLKARLLGVLEQVAEGEVVEVTKRGRVIARVVPATPAHGLRGAMRGIATSNASDAELYSTGDTWNVA